MDISGHDKCSEPIKNEREVYNKHHDGEVLLRLGYEHLQGVAIFSSASSVIAVIKQARRDGSARGIIPHQAPRTLPLLRHCSWYFLLATICLRQLSTHPGRHTFL